MDLDLSVHQNNHHRVPRKRSDLPYFDAWLRRTRRQFAISGRLSQAAVALSTGTGECPELWAVRLRSLLESEEPPSLDLLTRIDRILAKPTKHQPREADPDLFFG